MKTKTIVVLLVSILFLTGYKGFSQTSVSDVYITGNLTAGSTLTGYYTTSGGTGNDIVLSWYTVSPRISVGGAVNTYTILSADQGKNLYFKVAIFQNGTGTFITADSSAYSPAISANLKPVATAVKILGDLRSGKKVFGVYNYSDLENDAEGVSTYKWEVADDDSGTNPQTVSTLSASYTITEADITKHLRFSVTPVAASGTTSGSEVQGTWSAAAIVNDPPLTSKPTITYNLLNVNSILTGNYIYSDIEGDIESGSVYQWYSAPNGSSSFAPILGENARTHLIGIVEQGFFFKFHVTPKNLSGTGLRDSSNAVGPANSKPSASSLTIFGNTTSSSTLKARFNYTDVDSDPKGNCIFQWYRGSIPVAGATDSAYLLGPDDVGLKIKFDVIPVSSTGFPDTGDKKTSALSNTITDPTAVSPDAKDICLAGNRSAQSVLTGKYVYVKNGYNQENSVCLWLSGNDVIKSSICDPDKDDTLKLRETYISSKIRFAVIPRNKNGVRGDTVFSLPLANFTMPRESFTIADPDIALSAFPSGGFFSGTEVTNNIFSPKSVNYNDSPFSITYQLTIDTGSNTCVQRAYTKLSVSGVNLSFESFEDRYCQNHGTDTIYVRNMPKGFTGTFLLNDVISSYQKVNDTTIIIDPSKMSPGNKVLGFSADSTLGKHVEIPPRPFIIDAAPIVSISNLANDTVLCSNMVPLKLFVSHEPGVFTGPVTNRFLDPSGTVGNTIVSYTHTTSNGCIASVSVPIRINPAPKITFSAKDFCIENDNDITQFVNKKIFNPLTPADSVKKWFWSFYDAGGIDTSSLKEPGYLYKTGGIKKVVLTATTGNGCTTVKDSTIDLGVKPKADFYWTKECYHKNDSIFLKDTTTWESSITSRTWIFNDKDIFNRTVSELSQGYLKLDSGYIKVQYIVRTNYVGCYDTAFKNVYIRPTIPLTSKDYFENFENGKRGWVKDYEPHNTWSFGTPNREVIKKAVPPGVNAWVTDFHTDTIEHSSIISPCFDFTAIERPMISMKLWKRFDLNRDGASLQYKIEDSKDWVYVGTLDDGINWYNSTLIKGRPGGDQIGWTSGAGNLKDTEWTESRHKLDELVGKKDVKFRITYGSDGTSQDNDGLAFDDIIIGSRTRGVLLEHFTNTNSSSGSTATTIISNLANSETKDIINIQYHTNFPGSDPYYNDNPGDASARFLFYGLSRVPYSFIDGGTRNNYANIYDYLNPDFDNNYLTRRSLISPSFSITLNSDVNGSILSVRGKIKAIEAVSAENLTLYLAVTEKKNSDHSGALGETDFYNVFRKFIPDAGGISIKKTWAEKDSIDILEQTWVIENIASNSKIDIIAFIQNNITKEIYQAQVSPDTSKTVGIDNIFANNGRGFSLFPNPASEKLTIEFEKPLQSETEIMIYDFNGAMVRIYKAAPDQTLIIVPDIGLKNGIYLVKIKSGGIYWGSKKLIVSNY